MGLILGAIIAGVIVLTSTEDKQKIIKKIKDKFKDLFDDKVEPFIKKEEKIIKKVVKKVEKKVKAKIIKPIEKISVDLPKDVEALNLTPVKEVKPKKVFKKSK